MDGRQRTRMRASSSADRSAAVLKMTWLMTTLCTSMSCRASSYNIGQRARIGGVRAVVGEANAAHSRNSAGESA